MHRNIYQKEAEKYLRFKISWKQGEKKQPNNYKDKKAMNNVCISIYTGMTPKGKLYE